MGAIKIKSENRPKSLVVEKEGFFDSTRVWLEQNGQKLVIAALGALFLVLAAWGFQSYSESKESKAREDYVAVMKDWPRGESPSSEDWGKFAGAAEQFLGKYSDASVGSYARLDLARASYAQGKYEDAYKWGKQGVDGISQDSPLKSLSLYQMALTCKELGKLDESLGYLQTLKAMAAAGMERELNWQLARIYAGKSDYSKALESYESALKAGGTYPAEAMIKEDMGVLKSKSEPPAVEGQKKDS